jgi:hypothetical protein
MYFLCAFPVGWLSNDGPVHAGSLLFSFGEYAGLSFYVKQHIQVVEFILAWLSLPWGLASKRKATIEQLVMKL